MDWIKNNTLTFVFIIVCAVSILVVCISALITFLIQKHIQNKSVSSKNFVIGMEIDLSNGRVIFFDRKDCSKHRTISVESFYRMLHKKDVLRMKLWFEDIKRNFDFSEKYIETEILNKRQEGFMLLLRANSYDETKKILYLECHQLSRMNPSQGRKKAMNTDYYIVKRSQIESAFESMKRKNGYVFSIRFFYKNNDVINDTTIEKSILYRLKNEVYSYVGEAFKNRYVYDEYDDQIYLFDFKIKNDVEAKNLCEKIYKDLSIYINVKGFSNAHGTAIGAVNLVSSNLKFIDSIKKSSQVSDAARVNEVPYLISDNETDSLHAFDSSLVDKVFDNGSLRLLFRPIINIKTEQIIGYFGNVKCVDTHFESYFEIARYINKVDRNEELLSKVTQQFVSKFFFERPRVKSRLFLQVSLVDLDHLGKVLSNIAHSKEANLVLMFEESEVNANVFSLDLLTHQLKELVSLGYEIGLLLKNENTLLENEFYSIFNYFIIGSAMVSKVKDNSRARLSNKFLIESLLQYKRPIVITDLEGWSTIDLFVKSGCYLLSGDDISASSEMILPIEKAKIARLRKINN
ncbi:MAG: hypothetical protein MJZ37_09695 [Bacilli bacterium]|nr:hypothetical protein [Bacilli bacterium]